MPTEIPMPSASIWDQYAVAAIVFIVIIVLLVLAGRAFGRYLKWQTDESQVQRTWYEGMERKRDEKQAARDLQWQQFYQQIQEHQAKRDRESNEIMSRMITRIDGLTEVINNHDRKSAERMEDLVGQVRVNVKRRAS